MRRLKIWEEGWKRTRNVFSGRWRFICSVTLFSSEFSSLTVILETGCYKLQEEENPTQVQMGNSGVPTEYTVKGKYIDLMRGSWTELFAILIFKPCVLVGNQCSPSVLQKALGCRPGTGQGRGTAEGLGGGRGLLSSLGSSNQRVLTSINELLSVKSLKTVEVYNVKEC